MEKLQAALERARGARSGLPPAQPAPARGDATAPARPAAPPLQTDAAWADLTGLELDSAHLAKGRIVALSQGNAGAPFDMLRTRVLQMMRANKWRRVAITSPDMGCGKTTLSINLALSLARSSDLRTILYECDMRRPSMAHIAGLPRNRAAGTAEVLSGMVPFAEAAYRVGPGMAILANKGVFPGSAELLQSTRCAEVLIQIEQDYAPGIELFDLPPLLACDDTVGFLGQVDCALLVVEAGGTQLEAIDRCERELSERTNVMGVVLNKNRFDEDSDRSYYYY